jgi:hypothetical protein
MPAPVIVFGDDDFAWIAAAIVLPVFGLLLVGFVLVVRDTIRGKGRWGVNTKPVFCKNCGAKAPVVRKPKSLRETLWGGWTCDECGLEMDKWGEPVPDQREAEERQRGDER